MRISSVVMLGAALVFGLSAAFLAKVWMENQSPTPVVAQKKPAVSLGTVVVAKQPLRFGMEVKRAHLSEIEWPNKG